MIFHWFTLFLGFLCIEGYLTFSPLPEENWDNEWIQYNQLLSDPSYRLPTTTLPSHYNVILAPIFEIVPPGVPDGEPFTFTGKVSITISATEENVREIVLHCNDLTIYELTVSLSGTSDNLALNDVFQCETPWSFLKINLKSSLDTTQTYIIESKFKGNLQSNMRGFYRSWYIDSSGVRRWMATTQFQPGHARQAFPCYDEPGFKARFDITITREADFSPTLSNMPIKSRTTTSDGRISETFHTTTVTSTYLVAFIVSHYKRISSGENSERPFYIYARDNALRTGEWSLEVGEKLLVAMENYTQYPYYSMTPNIIMQQAAIPDFSAGAMENWGLLTYREALILYDPVNSNHFYKQRVANIVSHEVVHQWFGNLVTCAWWDNLWLNEGFARFYQYYLTAEVAPELGYETRFIVEQVQVSLLSDSASTAHALTNPSVNDPATVSAHFSQITYGKGAAVLRMTQELLGEETYRKGLRLYLNRNEWSVAEPKDLFNALDDAAAEDNALAMYEGITVDQYMRSWSEQSGHPFIEVRVNQTTGEMIIVQYKFDIDVGVTVDSTLWHIPITWTRGGAPEFTNLKPTEIMKSRATMINKGTTDGEWVIFNIQQSGFYRVNYDKTTWSLITQALKGRSQIHEYNRAQIVDDVFNFARSGLMRYNDAFRILSFLWYEDQYAPWIAAIAGFNFCRRRLAHSNANVAELELVIESYSGAVIRRLGFAEIEGEPYMDGLLRMYVSTFLCNARHPQCTVIGRVHFSRWRNLNVFIPPNMRPWVYCTGLRYGTAEDFLFFWRRYLRETLASEQVVMLTAAGCTRDAGSLAILLDAITAGPDDFSIRDQDQSTALNSALTSNEENTLIAFEWLKANVDRTRKALGSINSPLSTIASRLLNEEQISMVSSWLETNRAEIGDAAYNAGISGINTSRKNMEWYRQRASEFEEYFDNPFGGIDDDDDQDNDDQDNDDHDDDFTSSPSLPPTTIISTTTEGSAGTATLSLVIFLFTFAFNVV